MKTKTKDPKKPAKASTYNLAPPQPTPQRDERRAQGNELRKKCPRSTHADISLETSGRDPMSLLEESNRGRVESLLPIRFTRMIESPFAFFRGTAILQAHDLQGTPVSGINVQCCGDCHLMNFGGFATPERTMAFDINDFDETHPGPFEWDIKRLATSFVLAARWRKFSKSDARRAAQTAAAAYRQAQARFAERSVLDTWYAMVTFDQVLKNAGEYLEVKKQLQKDVTRAAHNTSDHVYHKITRIENGKPLIADQPPLLFHSAEHRAEFDELVAAFFADYRKTLQPDRQTLFERYRLIDSACKVVGVGSVGTRCYIALFEDRQDEHLFLQIKEARSSVLEGRAGPTPYANQGERVVSGQRLMQAASDIFLGWSRATSGRDFYVRQLRDMKMSANLASFTPEFLCVYAQLCGETLARAHAKAGDPAMIAGYLGTSETFDQAIRDYAVAYADQVEKDFETFQQAVSAGRFPTETSSTEVEQAIR